MIFLCLFFLHVYLVCRYADFQMVSCPGFNRKSKFEGSIEEDGEFEVVTRGGEIDEDIAFNVFEGSRRGGGGVVFIFFVFVLYFLSKVLHFN